MYRLTVLYGRPTDPAAFDRYYHEVHLPLARKIRGIEGWTIGKCEPIAEGETPPYYMIVEILSKSRADLEALLDSPEGRAAVADVPNFATGGATFLFDEETVIVPFEVVENHSPEAD